MSCGRAQRVERHARRLRRDAVRLGLPAPPAREIEDRLIKAAHDAFPHQDGIVRIEWSAEDHTSPPALRITTRSLGQNPSRWHARIADAVHPGPEDRKHAKATEMDAIAQAREEMLASGADEMLLLDAKGLLVEGAHSSCLIADEHGKLATPPLSLGGVEGIGLQILRESGLSIQEARIDREQMRRATEIMGVNCVRGVVPIVAIDAQPIGRGEPGPWAQRLRHWFSCEAN